MRPVRPSIRRLVARVLNAKLREVYHEEFTMMRRLLLLVAALVLSASTGWADPLCSTTATLNPIPSSAATLTVGASACSLVTCTGGATLPANAYAALISVETNAIRYWDDGSTPTATTGQSLPAASTVAACGPAVLTKLLFIQQSAAATLRVSYYAK
jgi:hypothetical protein